MHSLKQLQQEFKQHLFSADSNILQSIVDDPNVSNEQRMGAYFNAYYARLHETLEKDFEGIVGLIGEDTFSSLCADYIQRHPSTHYSLRWFGRYFAEFIRDYFTDKKGEYLAELARLEWGFINAFDAQDTKTIDHTVLADIPAEAWPGLKLKFHPSIQLINYHWNIVDLWRAVRDGDNIPPAFKLECQSSCLIWRKATTTSYRILSEQEDLVLKHALAGENFSALCECLYDAQAEQKPDINQVAMQCVSWLKSWMNESMVIGVELDSA